jgi:uncharacterized protein YggU (UPF0235/DUF167 family)
VSRTYTSSMAAPSTRLRLRVSPSARGGRHGVIGRHGEAWKLRVAAVPKGGEANEAVLRLLADELDLPRASLTLVSGHSARDKVIALTGIDARETERRLERSDRGR